MKSILVGIDGSTAAAGALRWAGRLAVQIGAELVVATVVEPHDADVLRGSPDDLRAKAQAHLDCEWTDPIRTMDIPHRTLLLTGDPDSLLTAAGREDVDLIVVGTRGGGGFDRLHIGGLAHHLAHTTDRPLALVPLLGAEHPPTRIVVGVDGSESSAAAVAWCAEVASAGDMDVLGVYAFEPLAEWVPQSDPRGWRRAAEHHMTTEWLAPLGAAGLEVRTKIVQDIHPVAGLTTAAADDEAGMIVVGTRDLIGGLDLRLGRFPLQLVHQSQLPVVLVPS